jgi:peroxiredoxin 2/4
MAARFPGFCAGDHPANLGTQKVATPEEWQPGDKVIVPPPGDVNTAEAPMNEGCECTDWYFCKKSL